MNEHIEAYIFIGICYCFPILTGLIYLIYFSSFERDGLICIILFIPIFNWIMVLDNRPVKFKKEYFNRQKLMNHIHFLPVLMLGFLWCL